MARMLFCCFLYLAGCSQDEPTAPSVLSGALTSDRISEVETETHGEPTSVSEVEAALTSLLVELYPGAETVDASPDHYRVTFDTMQFIVHGRDKMGRFSDESYEIEGPNNLGFILDVRRRDERYIGAAVMPQTFRNPYWETSGYELQPEGRGLSVRYSYGWNVKTEFHKAIIDLFRQEAQ